MIEKLYAVKIISACIKYNISGDAYAFGDQIPTFSKEWAVNAWERLSNGLSVPDGSDNEPSMSSDFYSETHIRGSQEQDID